MIRSKIVTKSLYDIENCGLPAYEVFQCPPKDAIQYTGMIYRFGHDEQAVVLKDSEPIAKYNQRFKNSYDKDYETLCQGSGLSSFLNLKDAVNNLERMKRSSRGIAKKFKSIHSLVINSGDGVVKATPSKNTTGHHTFWPFLTFNYLENAKVIQSEKRG